ncbi:NAD(P)H-dependent flavin oxidoreductase [Hyphomonas pacifica]|uniref:NAD(P)H-dependent flavin oxidoreductase n=1 Tax=Hyphomonas pacifica TaxID=1280941 RepID=UPI000DBFA974|nr:DUF561 domain-containing protein [Hyphomonas pacifica]RAN32951.1 hypothetical protein HY11_04475 [Hyphomonas pacifica]
MKYTNALTERLGLTVPIIQAPMAGSDSPGMVAAAGEAGALGSMGCSYMAADQVRDATSQVRTATNRGFNVNLFAPLPIPDRPSDLHNALNLVAPYHEALGLAPPEAPQSGGFDFDSQVEALLDSGASVFSFAFGVMPPEVIAAARDRGMFIIGMATTVEEAVALEQAGVDAVVAQGSESGGHRGSFLGDFTASMVGTIALVPQMVDAVSVPVIASGGIADGRGIAAALTLGASAVQIGTAFLACEEAGIPQVYKDTLIGASPSRTRITRAFSGRPARGIVNDFMEAAEAANAPDTLLPFPYQNALTRPMRKAAAQQGKAEYLSLWAGQGVGLTRRMTTQELIDAMMAETEAALARVSV